MSPNDLDGFLADLDDASGRAFLLEFPDLLIEWYKGKAMSKTYRAPLATVASAAYWDEGTFHKFYDWVWQLAKAVPTTAPMKLYRGVSLPNDNAAALVASPTPTATPRNALHSWGDALPIVERFYKDTGKGLVPPGHTFLIMKATMPVNRIGLTYRSAEKVAAWGKASVSLDASLPGRVKEAWIDLDRVVRKYTRQREVICLGLKPLPIEIVKRYKPN